MMEERRSNKSKIAETTRHNNFINLYKIHNQRRGVMKRIQKICFLNIHMNNIHPSIHNPHKNIFFCLLFYIRMLNLFLFIYICGEMCVVFLFYFILYYYYYYYYYSSSYVYQKRNKNLLFMTTTSDVS